jgi:nitronate monooxygenase
MASPAISPAVSPTVSPAVSPNARAEAFCRRFGLTLPILLAPMAGVSAVPLSAAVAAAGGLGSLGAVLMAPQAILDWAAACRSAGNGGFQINLWIPDPPPARDPDAEAALRGFLAGWGPAVEAKAGDATPPDFAAQCEALLDAGPALVSSVMGLYPPDFVRRLKQRGIAWCATATTLTEALAAAEAGADIIAVQGMEAGGHRGGFDPVGAERDLVGLFALIPAVADAVRVPVVAAGGIADGRGIAAALALGASAVQIGTGFLRCPEAALTPAWADALAQARPEATRVSRVFSGRPGRSLSTSYVEAATAATAPPPAPYPVQRGLTQAMRGAAAASNRLDGLQAWAGQSAALARAEPAGDLARRWWAEAKALLG